VEKKMEPRKILIVEDSHPSRDYLTELVQILGFQAHPVMQKADFLSDLNLHNPDVLLLGSCPNPGQMKAFARVVELENNSLPMICITGGSDGNDMELQALPSGDNICYLPESFNPEDLKRAIHRMITESQDGEYEILNETIVGGSNAMVEIKKNILRLSKSDVTVLITGESGTGKELVARAIHDLSLRAQKPFVKVNSAALPDNLIESELFGYERGAFTGAWRSKPGKFLLAHAGTLLLDEIGEIPLHLQPKLLQVLEDDEVSALGSTTNAEIDVRVLASTNSDLKQGVEKGRFRADLYYRLNVISIHIPPLRDRMEDIAPLCEHFLKKHSALNGNAEIKINGGILEQMHRYAWPGNIRELENTLKRFSVLRDEESFFAKLRNQYAIADSVSGLVPEHIVPLAKGYSGEPMARLPLKEVTKMAARKAETDTILDVLSYTRWNRRKTASLLKISYKALLNKIKEYEIEDRYRELNRELAKGQMSPASAEASAWQGGRGRGSMGIKH
jgi:two-component system, NtrC family, response regulator AtoC